MEVLLICLWFMGTMGASDDPHKLALTNELLEAVICEAKARGTGQPVINSGHINAEPSVVPVTANVLKFGHPIDLEGAYASGRGVPPSPTCRFALDGAPGTRRGFFFWYAPLLWLRVLVVRCFLRDGSGLTSRSVLGLAWVPGLLRLRLLGWCHLLHPLVG